MEMVADPELEVRARVVEALVRIGPLEALSRLDGGSADMLFTLVEHLEYDSRPEGGEALRRLAGGTSAVAMVAADALVRWTQVE